MVNSRLSVQALTSKYLEQLSSCMTLTLAPTKSSKKGGTASVEKVTKVIPASQILPVTQAKPSCSIQMSHCAKRVHYSYS